MQTRCPHCGSAFPVSASQLRQARGEVRCGRCARVFNAIDALVDDVPAAAGEEEASFEFDAPEQTWSQFFIEETPSPAPRSAPAPGPKPAADAAGGVPLDDELETATADPEEWQAFLEEIDRAAPGTPAWDVDGGDDPGPVFVVGNETRTNPPARSEPAADGAARRPDGGPAATAQADDDSRGAGDTSHDRFASRWPEADPPGNSGPRAWLDPEGHDDGDRPAAPVPSPDDDPHGSRPAFPDVGPEWPAPAAPAGAADGWPDEHRWAAPEPAPARRALLPLAALLTALLGAQLVHLNRDSLAAHPRYGGPIRTLYAALGQALYPEWPLDAFAVRRAEALAGGSAPEALDISGAIELTGAAPAALPLVRIVLRDQWQNAVAGRVFAPEEYLAEAMPMIVDPGTRIPVRLSVADPGVEARGYVLDVCLARRTEGLVCQLERDPFRR